MVELLQLALLASGLLSSQQLSLLLFLLLYQVQLLQNGLAMLFQC